MAIVKRKENRNSFFLSFDHTLALKGLSAFMIMLFHYAMLIEGYPRIFNIIGGPCVAVFLFLSGYGINESWKKNNGVSYWKKRIKNVLIPYWIVIIFQIPFYDKFHIDRLLHNIFIYGSDLWFIDFILRWYIVYWISKKFFPIFTDYILLAFSLCCFLSENLMAGQAFSFFIGYMFSQYSEKTRKIYSSTNPYIPVFCLLFATIMIGIKELEFFQTNRESIYFKLLLAFINLPLAISFITISSHFPALCRNIIIKWLGNISYEIYIIHYNFFPNICNKIINIGIFSCISLIVSDLFHHLLNKINKKVEWEKSITLLFFVLINYLFACKYTMRATDNFGYIIIPYVLILSCIALYVVPTILKAKFIKKWHTLLFFTFIITVLLVIQYHFDPMLIMVDRWSAIDYPIKNLLNGDFPYLTRTHLGGKASPFPVWQIFHIPFYIMGNVGLSEIFSIGSFIISIWYLNGHRHAFAACLLIISSIAIIYEVSVRSDLISNFMLLSAFINICQKRNISFNDKPYILSFIAGLWLSTRLTTLLPLFILYIPAFLTISYKRKVFSVIIGAGTLVLTFLPFYLWNAEALIFDSTSPFVLQTRQGGFLDILLTLSIVILLCYFYIKSYNKYITFNVYAAMSIIILTTCSFVRRMIEVNGWNKLFESMFDITYFNAALPFLITIISINYIKNNPYEDISTT